MKDIIIAVIVSGFLGVGLKTLFDAIWYNKRDKQKLINQQLKNETLDLEIKHQLNNELNSQIKDKITLLQELITVKGNYEEMKGKLLKCEASNRKLMKELGIKDIEIELLKKNIKNK